MRSVPSALCPPWQKSSAHKLVAVDVRLDLNHSETPSSRST